MGDDVDLRSVREALHRKFDRTADLDLINRELDRAILKFSQARIRAYLPVLIEREVAARLRRVREAA